MLAASARRAFFVSAIAAAGCSLIYETGPLTEGGSNASAGGRTSGGGSAGVGQNAGAPNGASGSGSQSGSTATGGTSGTSSTIGGAGPGDGGAAGDAMVAGAAGAPLLDCSSTWYPDADGDGYGNDSEPGVDCETPGYAPAGDCADDDPFRNPGLSELCDDLDNDCDAETVEVCPLNCLPDTFEDHVYMFCWWPMQTWDDASAICESQLMRMVRLDDSDEQDYVFGWHDPDHSWLGGSDVASNGTWQWEDGAVFWDGTPQLYENWGVDEPNNTSGNAHCLILDGVDNYWNDFECDEPRPFTCERY